MGALRLACLVLLTMPLCAGCDDGDGTSTGTTTTSTSSSSSTSVSSSSGGTSCVGLALETDPDNCGVCGKSCGGGACEAGVCQAFVLESFPDPVTSVAVDDSSVYVATTPTEGGVGTIEKVSKEGGQTTNLVMGLANPDKLRVAGGRLFYVHLGTRVRSIAPDGTGEVDYPFGAVGPIALGVDGSSVYYGLDFDLVRASHDATTSQVLVERGDMAPGVISAFPNGTTVYFTLCAADGVQQVPAAGGSAAALGSSFACPVDVVHAGASVFVSDAASLLEVADDGSTEEELDDCDTALAAAGRMVAYGAGDQIRLRDAFAKQTRTVATVDSGAHVSACAADDTAVYCGDDVGRLFKVVY